MIVDASVAVKWVIKEEFSDLADDLYAMCLRRGQPPAAPSLLPNEVCNAIYQRYRRGDLLEHEADAAVLRLPSFRLDLVTPPDLAQEAYAFTRMHQLRAVYDSLYIVLAARLGVDLWTADERLINSVRAIAPWVRWIGDYAPDA